MRSGGRGLGPGAGRHRLAAPSPCASAIFGRRLRNAAKAEHDYRPTTSARVHERQGGQADDAEFAGDLARPWRIALDYEAHAPGRLTVVPVGLSFEARKTFRGRVLVSFGEPVVVSPFFARCRKEPVKALHALTTTIQWAMEREVVHGEHIDTAALARAVVTRREHLHYLVRVVRLPVHGNHAQRDEEPRREIVHLPREHRPHEPRGGRRDRARPIHGRARKSRRSGSLSKIAAMSTSSRPTSPVWLRSLASAKCAFAYGAAARRCFSLLACSIREPTFSGEHGA
jgi:hypothetical protein